MAVDLLFQTGRYMLSVKELNRTGLNDGRGVVLRFAPELLRNCLVGFQLDNGERFEGERMGSTSHIVHYPLAAQLLSEVKFYFVRCHAHALARRKDLDYHLCVPI